MQTRAALPIVVATAVTLLTVAACSGSSDGNGTPTSTATRTVTSTDTVTSSASRTGTGGSASSSAPSSGATTGSRTTASGPGLCTPTVMTFAVTRGVGAAGSSYFAINATNASSSPCVTTGYPGLAFLDADGHQILQAGRDTTSKPTTLTVPPGGVVNAVVRVSDIGNGSQQCPTSPAFLFTLPDNTDSTRLTRSTPACSATVRAFVSGAGS